MALSGARYHLFRGVYSGYAKFVYVQVRGVEKPAKVAADEAKEELGGAANPPHRLKLLLGGKPVGEFKFDNIDGWWIEDWQP
jgi:hypothetical protein